MSSAQTPPRGRTLVPVYALAAAVALAWRALAMPWDFGGLFIQFVATAFGVMVFVAAKPPTRGRVQRAVFYALFTASCGLWSFEAYYDPGAALPFVISCFILALVWAGDKRTSVKLVNTLAVALPVAALITFGVYGAAPAYRLRNLDAGRVHAVEFLSASYGVQGGETRVELTSREDVAEFVDALRETTPYAPSHLRDPSLWLVTVVLNSGERLQFRLDDTTGRGPTACRLLLRGDYYQNRDLCRIVRSRVARSNQY